MKIFSVVLMIILFLRLKKNANALIRDNFVYKVEGKEDQQIKEIDVYEKVSRCTSDILVGFFDKGKNGNFLNDN